MIQLQYQYIYPVTISFICAITAILYSYKLHHKIISPLSVHAVGWLVPTVVFVFPIGQKFQIGALGWVAIYGSFASFYVGYLASMRISVFNLQFRNSGNLPVITWDRYLFRVVLLVLFSIGMLGFLINIHHLATTTGLDTYFSQGFRKAELVFGGVSSVINYLFFINAVSFSLSLIYIRIYGFDPFPAVISIISFGTLPFHGIKSTIILPMLISTFTLLLIDAQIRYRYMVSFATVAIVSFILVNIIGRQTLGGSTTFFMIIWSAIESIILYIRPNYANLYLELLYTKSFSLGLGTLSSFVRLITLETVDIYNGNSFLVDPAYNVSTYLTIFFKDYNWLGIIIGPLYIGIISGYFYKWYLTAPSILNVWLNAIILSMNFMAFWGNHFLRIQYWWFMFIVLLVWIITPKSHMRLRRVS